MTHKESMSQAVKLTRLGSLKTNSDEKERQTIDNPSTAFITNVRNVTKQKSNEKK